MNRPTVEIEISFLKEIAASSTPVRGLSGGGYRPHFVVGDPNQREIIKKLGTNEIVEHYLGVAFIDGPSFYKAGETVKATAVLLYYPGEPYSELVRGATFTIREGGRIIGFGRVISRRDD